MKKLGLIGLVLLTTAGCGQGWLPFRPFRGAPCQANCVGAVAQGNDCQGCAGYSTYDGEMGSEYSGVPTEGYYGTPQYGSSTLPPPASNQPMAPITGAR
jgi:hypothetical protein